MKGRITKKKLIHWLNEKFDEVGIESYQVVNVESTRLRGTDYERGAAKLIVTFENKENSKDIGTFHCFYSLLEYTEYLKRGYKLALGFNSPNRHGLNLITDLIVDVTKA